MTSVDVGLGNVSTVTKIFRVAPNNPDNGRPDVSDSTKVIALTNPTSFSENSLNTFTAPANTKLAANTIYHLFLTGDSSGDTPGEIQRTTSNGEDAGGAAGWTIGNTRHWRTHSGNPWQVDTTKLVRMQINGLPAGVLTRVSNDWSLTPSELGARDQFRLLFLSSTTRNATSSDIDGLQHLHPEPSRRRDTPTYRPTAMALRSSVAPKTTTPATTPRTTFTGSDKGVPIYWLNGTKVADEYQDFYDGSWDNSSNTHDRDELGINSANTSQSGNRPWTGCTGPMALKSFISRCILCLLAKPNQAPATSPQTAPL